jgi:hypothetical protein
VRALLPRATDVQVREASLRELFIALATRPSQRNDRNDKEVAA